MQRTGLRQLLPNLFKSRSPKLVQNGSWKPNLFNSVPTISDICRVLYIWSSSEGRAPVQLNLPPRKPPPSAIRLSRSVFPPVHPPFKCTVSPLACSHTGSYCSPRGSLVNCFRSGSVLDLRHCGRERRPAFACGDGRFAGTSVLVVQMNVLSFDVLTVHVLIN